MRYQLDTYNAGCDEVLEGDLIADVTQDVLNRYELHELPEDWTITPIDEEMSPSQVKSAIPSRLSPAASDYWHNTTEQNDFVELALQDGVDAAVEAIEEAAKRRVELAVYEPGGSWQLLGDYETVDVAKAAAIEWAKNGTLAALDDDWHHFGISEDPASGHFEIDFRVQADSGESFEL